MTIALFCYVCTIGIKNFFRYNAFKAEYNSLLTSLEKETRLKEYYENYLVNMQKTEFWELVAKKHLGFIKKGEVVYKLIDPK